MASRSGFRRATSVVGLGSCFYKAAASVPPAFRSDNKYNELGAPEKNTPAPSHTNSPTLVELILALQYSKVDLMRILKIFLETISQELKVEVPCKRPLKAKVPDVYFEKSHMDCYHLCQQCEDYFEIASTTESNRTPFATLFLCENINFW